MTDVLGSYSFLPYVRSGIARLITAADSPSVTAQRSSVLTNLQLTGTAVSGSDRTQDFTKTVELYGPGDVIGIDQRAIIRMEPRPSSTNAETPYLAHIEFYDEDFCWRYTPAAPDTQQWRLRPWITLVVLAEGEFDEGGVPEAKALPYIDLRDDATLTSKFPPADQLWAWAHVHVNANLTSSDTGIVSGTVSDVVARLRTVITDNPDLAYSRLVSPRKLAPKTAYHAFVMPSFEAGRLAGLGLPPSGAPRAMHAAWETYPSRNQAEPKRFPYYHRWSFRTGGPGDFESLVRLLVPKPVDSRVGTRDVDLRSPGSNLTGLSEDPPLGGVLRLGGALKVPDSNLSQEELRLRDLYENWDDPYPHELQLNLARLLNLPNEYARAGVVAAEDGDCDPVVTPPIYGQWHALATRLLGDVDGRDLPDNRNWLHELNLDPRHRMAAGLGTAIIIREQERFMEASWAQVGAVLEANRRIRLAQLAKQTAWSWFHRQIKPLHDVDKARALQIVAPMQLRMVVDGKTMRGTLLESRLQPAALSVVTRRTFRPTARIGRFASAVRRPQALFQGIGAGAIHPVAPKTTPAGVPTMQKLRRPGVRTGLSALVERAVGIAADRVTAQTLDALPRASLFVVREPGDSAPFTHGTTIGDSTEAIRFKNALKSAFAMIDESFATSAPAKKPVDVAALAGRVIGALDPSKTIPARLQQRVTIPDKLRSELVDGTMVEAMAYPVIDEPLYKPLAAMSAELLLPNINLIPPNSITLLESNRPFIESVCVGANHEWAREALWQEYPTDQRGSPLRQFWALADNFSASADNVDEREELRDIAPIDKWRVASTLGGHYPDAPQPRRAKNKENIVLTIRGDLLRRYPTAVIMAQRAAWQMTNGRIDNSQERVLLQLTVEEEDDPPRSKVRTPMYEAKVEPDIYFFGFDLTEEEVKGGTGEDPNDDPGWFFVIKGRPGEPRFGLDEGTSTTLEVWNDLTWQRIQPGAAGSFIQINNSTPTLRVTDDPLETDDQEKEAQRAEDQSVTWRKDMSSADVAYILLSAPVLIAVHAAEMLGHSPAAGASR